MKTVFTLRVHIGWDGLAFYARSGWVVFLCEVNLEMFNCPCEICIYLIKRPIGMW